jgi:hypothetical protein
MATLMTIRYADRDGDIPIAIQVPALDHDVETIARQARMKMRLHEAIEKMGERYVLHESKRITREVAMPFILEQTK